ncbi:MAG: PHB depolymerase family esterase [Bacteroidota bacterium]|nr:PHB depolymerase family esterase [Bacteroidota bacterium]
MDQITRPYVLYTPVNKNDKKPLIVFLHGSISSPKLKTNPLDYAQTNKFNAIIEQQEYYILYPFGQQGATWFDRVGVDMIFGEIKEVIKNNNIDENKIFLAGFSDGASGTFYFSMTYPELFAGFIPLNGTYGVADKLGEYAIFPENTNQKSMFVVNTQSDMLYPSRITRPMIEHLKKFNPNIIYHEPEGGHDMGFVNFLKTDIQSFINSNKKQNLQSIVWESSQIGQINIAPYINVIEIDTAASRKSWHTQNTYILHNDKADLGIIFNNNYRGKGLQIEQFKYPNSTAERIGLEKGDVLIAFEQDTIRSKFSPMAYTLRKKAEDYLEVTFIRNGENKILKGNFNKATTTLIFDEDKSYKIKSRIEGNSIYIETSRIKIVDVDFKNKELRNIKHLYINNKKQKIKI